MNNVSEILDLRNKVLDDVVLETFETLQNLDEGEILEIIILENDDSIEVAKRIDENNNYRIVENLKARSGIHIFIKVY